jgi:hypothetical protein
MTMKWKLFVLLSLLLNLVSLISITRVGERLVEAQVENLALFQKLSSDQQSLRRQVNQGSPQSRQVGAP